MSGSNTGGNNPYIGQQNLAYTAQQDLTRLAVALQALVNASYVTQQTLAGGLKLNTTLPSFTVATLPTTGYPVNTIVFASNGRANGSQGAGAGTGTPVFWNGTNWIAIWSGVTITA
jgi:hypothetical protein